MQELRLVGVADDGEHLLLAGDDERFTVPLNEELKAAVRRDRRVTKGGAAATQPSSPLRPRDVQGLIRGGVPLDEIAERAGWSLEKVQRYEGPIRAERDYVSERAQAVVLPSRTETVTLRERADARLADRGVEAERVVWDSWKTDDVHWSVVVRFPAGGRLREATWLFDPINHSLRTVDDEARWLGGDELASAGEEAPEAAAKSVSTQQKRSAARAGERPAKVYDVEAEGGVTESQAPHLGSALAGQDGGALTESLRARKASRGRTQRGSGGSARATSIPGNPGTPDVARVETLDFGDAPPPSPSHPRPSTASASSEGTTRDPASPEGIAVQTDAANGGTTGRARAPKKGRATSSSRKTGLTVAEEPAEETADETSQTPETAPIPTQSKRRGSRRSRSSAERTPVRTAFTNRDEENDEGLFDELPGFHEGEDFVDEDVLADDLSDEEYQQQYDGAANRDVTDADAATDATPAATRSESSTPDEARQEKNDDAPSNAPRDVPERASKSRSTRPSVPSWDDIMFGGSRGPKR